MEFNKRAELTVTDIVPFGQNAERESYALILEKPQWLDWKAGQFVMVRPCSWTNDITWARPFSICRVTSQSLVLFFQVMGRGTKRMAQLKAGDKVVIWGPLGTHFESDASRPTLLLAGGIGIAPFAGYVDQHKKPSNLSMLFSHRLPIHYYPTDNFSLQIEMESIQEHSAADLATTLEKIKEQMAHIKEQNGLVLACGPMPFLKNIWRNAHELKVDTQISLEQRMACGVGACLGCVATTSETFADKSRAGLPVQTCTKGPVFWTHDLNLDAEGM